MSAASTPVPRSSPPAALRYSVFWPMLIFFLGFGAFTVYQIMTMEDRFDEITRAIDQMDTKVKWAQKQKATVYALAKDVLRLAPKDPNAEQIVVELNLRKLQATQPALMDLNAPTSPATSGGDVEPMPAATNSAPAQPSPATNAAPAPSLNPTVK